MPTPHRLSAMENSTRSICNVVLYPLRDFLSIPFYNYWSFCNLRISQRNEDIEPPVAHHWFPPISCGRRVLRFHSANLSPCDFLWAWARRLTFGSKLNHRASSQRRRCIRAGPNPAFEVGPQPALLPLVVSSFQSSFSPVRAARLGPTQLGR